MTLDGGVTPGTELPGGYRIGERLGSGGMGVVHRAFDHDRGRVVAIKLLREDADGRRLREEIRVLSALSHPGLVGILDDGEYHGHPFLVLDYVSGPTLRELLELGAMRPEEVARVGTAVARTLAYVHAHGIVHRDVKPSNVLVTDEGRPMLNDFGVAYRHGRTRWTESGFVNGTAAYLAPEQVRGEPPGPALDVYALGLVLLECLSGLPEYDGTAIEAAVARLHRRPRRPSGTPDWLADALMAMTVDDPADRPTATEAADLLAGARPSAQPAPHATRARMALLAGTGTAVAAGLAVALLLPGTAPTGTAGEPVTPMAPPPIAAEAPATPSTPATTTPAPTTTVDGTFVPPPKPPAVNQVAHQSTPLPGKGHNRGHGKGSGPGAGPGLGSGKGGGPGSGKGNG